MMNKNQHRNRMWQSSIDDVALVVSIEEKMLELVAMHKRTTGEDLVIPIQLKPAALTWRRVYNRHKQDDMRHTLAEMHKIQEFAQWTVDVARRLRGQDSKIVQWDASDAKPA